MHEAMKLVVQAVMEMEASIKAGAKRYERTPNRETQRNGHRHRQWDTPVGSIELGIPKFRRGLPAGASPRSDVRSDEGVPMQPGGSYRGLACRLQPIGDCRRYQHAPLFDIGGCKSIDRGVPC